MFVVEIFEPWSGRWYPFRVFSNVVAAEYWVWQNRDRNVRLAVFAGVV